MTAAQRETPHIRQFWLRGDQADLAVSLIEPSSSKPGRHAVLIARSIGHEDQTTDSGLFRLGEALAAAGVPALIVGHAGTDQSTGNTSEPDIVERWIEGLHRAVDFLREHGYKTCTIIGPRLGALLCLNALPIEGVTSVVLWSAVTDGRRYVRGLRLLGASAKDAARGDDGSLSIAGYGLSAELLNSIERLKANPYTGCRDVLVIHNDERPIDSRTLEALRQESERVTCVTSLDIGPWIDQPSDASNVPATSIKTIVDWVTQLGDSGPESSSPPPLLAYEAQSSIVIHHQGTDIVERFVNVGDYGLSGVVSAPLGDEPVDRPAVLLLSTRGPGRSFVDLARSHAVSGRTVLRYDFAGFGASVTDTSDSLMFSSQGQSDLRAGVEYLTRLGHSRVVVVGFCAGAWTALSSPPIAGVAAIAAINVELFITDDSWMTQPDRPGRWSGMLRRLNVRGRLRRLMTLLPHRPASAKWLQRFAQRGVRVGLFLDETDHGFRFYSMQVRPRIRQHLASGMITMNQYAKLGHMTEGIDRDVMLTDVSKMVDELER